MYAVSPRRQQKKIETYVIISIYLNIGRFKLRIGVIRKTPAHYYSTLYNTLPPAPQNTSLRTHIHTHFRNEGMTEAPTTKTPVTKAPDDKSPRGQKPQMTEAPDNKNPRRQKPQTTKTPGDESPRRQKPWGYFPTKDMKDPPPPQFWSGFYGWCTMCWNEWKINFQIFIFELTWIFNENWGHLSTKVTKNDHNSKNKSRKLDFPFDSASFM